MGRFDRTERAEVLSRNVGEIEVLAQRVGDVGRGLVVQATPDSLALAQINSSELALIGEAVQSITPGLSRAVELLGDELAREKREFEIVEYREDVIRCDLLLCRSHRCISVLTITNPSRLVLLL